MGKFLDAIKGEIMSDKNLDKEVKVAVEATEDTKKASSKKEAIVEPVAHDAPVAEEAVSTEIVAEEEPLGFTPASYTFSAYNMWNPWVTAQNGDTLSYNTTVNSKDWAGAIVFQNGQYNTTQRGF
jgi:hypothetical protein